jgi:hypothetical protein
MFGSKMLLTMLSRLGFSITADEVDRFKQSVILSDEDSLPQKCPGSFTQWAADNVDHNVATLDGQGTFHGMGIISMSVCDSVDAAVSEEGRNRVCGGFGDIAVDA